MTVIWGGTLAILLAMFTRSRKYAVLMDKFILKHRIIGKENVDG